jgi:hypothetical protein
MVKAGRERLLSSHSLYPHHGQVAYRRLFVFFAFVVDGVQISKIKKGLCVLVGLSVDDTSADIDYMVRKLLSVRVFDSSDNALAGESSSSTSAADAQEAAAAPEEPRKMWAKSVVDIGGEILCGKANKEGKKMFGMTGGQAMMQLQVLMKGLIGRPGFLIQKTDTTHIHAMA